MSLDYSKFKEIFLKRKYKQIFFSLNFTPRLRFLCF